MDVLWTKFKWQFALVYLYDIFIFLSMPDEHISHAREVLIFLYDVCVTLTLKKWEVFTNRIDFHIHVICLGPFELSTRVIEAILGLEYPSTVMELRSCSGLGNVFRCFVPKFALIADHLNKNY